MKKRTTEKLKYNDSMEMNIKVMKQFLNNKQNEINVRIERKYKIKLRLMKKDKSINFFT